MAKKSSEQQPAQKDAGQMATPDSPTQGGVATEAPPQPEQDQEAIEIEREYARLVGPHSLPGGELGLKGKKQVIEMMKLREEAFKTNPQTEEPKEEAKDSKKIEEAPNDETKQGTGEPTKKVRTATDAEVTAQIIDALRTGKAKELEGNLAHAECQHGVGGLLEVNLGGKDRQERGRRVIKEVSRRFDVSISELYRAWKFYKLRPDFAAFRLECPTVTTWSAIKALLPDLEKGKTVDPEKVKRAKAKALVNRVTEDLKKLRDGLTGLNESVGLGELRDLVAELEKAAQEAKTIVTHVAPAGGSNQPATT